MPQEPDPDPISLVLVEIRDELRTISAVLGASGRAQVAAPGSDQTDTTDVRPVDGR